MRFTDTQITGECATGRSAERMLHSERFFLDFSNFIFFRKNKFPKKSKNESANSFKNGLSFKEFSRVTAAEVP